MGRPATLKQPTTTVRIGADHAAALDEVGEALGVSRSEALRAILSLESRVLEKAARKGLKVAREGTVLPPPPSRPQGPGERTWCKPVWWDGD
jgi:hypothetical protein